MDERRSPRIPVDLHADAYLNGRTIRVFVYDLSTGGCVLETRDETLPPCGALISLDFPDGMRVSGTLMWTNNRNGGVQFVEAIPRTVVSAFSLSSFGRDDGFRDQFGRHISLRGQRFDVARK